MIPFILTINIIRYNISIKGEDIMLYQNTLIIPDGSNDTFFGVLAIIAVIVLIYALAFAEISRKKTEKLKEAKRCAVENLNYQKQLNKVKEETDED